MDIGKVAPGDAMMPGNDHSSAQALDLDIAAAAGKAPRLDGQQSSVAGRLGYIAGRRQLRPIKLLDDLSAGGLILDMFQKDRLHDDRSRNSFLPKERLGSLQGRFELLQQGDAAARRHRGENTSHAFKLDDRIGCISAVFFADHWSMGPQTPIPFPTGVVQRLQMVWRANFPMV